MTTTALGNGRSFSRLQISSARAQSAPRAALRTHATTLCRCALAPSKQRWPRFLRLRLLCASMRQFLGHTVGLARRCPCPSLERGRHQLLCNSGGTSHFRGRRTHLCQSQTQRRACRKSLAAWRAGRWRLKNGRSFRSGVKKPAWWRSVVNRGALLVSLGLTDLGGRLPRVLGYSIPAFLAGVRGGWRIPVWPGSSFLIDRSGGRMVLF